MCIVPRNKKKAGKNNYLPKGKNIFSEFPAGRNLICKTFFLARKNNTLQTNCEKSFFPNFPLAENHFEKKNIISGFRGVHTLLKE